MPDTAPNLNSLDKKIEVILERISTIDKYLLKTTAQLEVLSTQIVEFNKEYITKHVTVENKVTAAHIRLDSLENKVDKRITEIDKAILDIQKMLIPMVSANKILTFIAAGFGISIIGLIWSLITGQVQLGFL